MLRGLLRELGAFTTVGVDVVPTVCTLIEDADSELPDALRPIFAEACQEIRRIEGCIRLVERQLEALTPQLPAVEHLLSIPGIGLLTATALVAFIGDVRRFPSGRHLASYLGLTPPRVLQGLKRYPGHISSAVTATCAACSSTPPAPRRCTPAPSSPTASRAGAHKLAKSHVHNKAAVAVANKLPHRVGERPGSPAGGSNKSSGEAAALRRPPVRCNPSFGSLRVVRGELRVSARSRAESKDPLRVAVRDPLAVLVGQRCRVERPDGADGASPRPVLWQDRGGRRCAFAHRAVQLIRVLGGPGVACRRVKGDLACMTAPETARMAALTVGGLQLFANAATLVRGPLRIRAELGAAAVSERFADLLSVAWVYGSVAN